MNLISIYVITLKNKDEYKKETPISLEENKKSEKINKMNTNYLSLKKITSKIILSKGVILNKEQEDKYYMYAKSSIAITFAHLKVWKYIIKKEKSKNDNHNIINDYSIILEDDAILSIKPKEYFKQIKNICKNETFDIYKLHSDFNNGFTSMAAYIINHKSINKLLENHTILIGHLDFDLYVLYLLSKINQVTHSTNMFQTDETESTNRLDKYSSLNLLSNIHLGTRCDKNLKQFLTFKVFRIFNYETIAFEIILFVLLIIAIMFRNTYLLFIIILLFIL